MKLNESTCDTRFRHGFGDQKGFDHTTCRSAFQRVTTVLGIPPEWTRCISFNNWWLLKFFGKVPSVISHCTDKTPTSTQSEIYIWIFWRCGLFFAYVIIVVEDKLIISMTRRLNTLRSTQHGRHISDDILNWFSWMKMYEFPLKFDWLLFLWVQLTTFQQWFT